MASFSITRLMFGTRGIAYIEGTTLRDRATILCHVTHQLVDQGNRICFGDDAVADEQIDQAIDKAKRDVCGIH